jgi:predicted ATPase
MKTLLATFDRVLARGRTELVLVSGYSGVGKSTFVNQLRKELAPSPGLFAAGRFDQFQRDIPYATAARFNPISLQKARFGEESEGKQRQN